MLSSRNALRPGLIYDIAREAGFDVQNEPAKTQIRCPLHDDRHPSAVLFRDTNCFFCCVCTTDKGLSAREFADAVGVAWPYDRAAPRVPRRLPYRAPRNTQPPPFGAADAARVWEPAKRRALDEVHVDEDRAAYEFVRRRRLERAWHAGLLGFLGPDNALKRGNTTWFDLGVRVVAPLFDASGKLQNLQGRNVLDREPRLLFPTGSRAVGGVFANAAGLAVLRGDAHDRRCMVLAEGLTDFLALATVPGLAVLSAPGAGMARHAVGQWARGVDLVLAFDGDDAGSKGRMAAGQKARGLGATRVRWVEWPSECKDACQLLDRAGVDGLDLFLAEHLGGGRRG